MKKINRKPFKSYEQVMKHDCCKCGKPAMFQWKFCADGIYRPFCPICDIKLQADMLVFQGHSKHYIAKIMWYYRKHVQRLMIRYEYPNHSVYYAIFGVNIYRDSRDDIISLLTHKLRNIEMTLRIVYGGLQVARDAQNPRFTINNLVEIVRDNIKE